MLLFRNSRGEKDLFSLAVGCSLAFVSCSCVTADTVLPRISDIVAANCPMPVDIQAKLRYRNLRPPLDGYENHKRYRNDGETMAFSSANYEDDRTIGSASEYFYRDGEFLLLNFHKNSLGNEHRTFRMKSAKFAPEIRVPTPGDIFNTSFGLVGVIGGYFFYDYFPDDSSTRVSEEDGLVVLRSTTRYGEAEGHFDPRHSLLITRIIVKKQGSDMISAGRQLRELRGDQKDASSVMRQATYTLDVTKFGQSSGKDYMTSPSSLRCFRNATNLSGTTPESPDWMSPPCSIRWAEDFIFR